MTKNDDRQELHPVALGQLFQSGVYLIETAAKQPSTSTTPLPDATIPTMGQFEKGILILVTDASAKVLNDEDFDLLTKILSAAKLSMADVQLANIYQSLPFDLPAKLSEIEPRVVLAFGLLPEDLLLPMRFPPFQVQPWGKTTFMVSPSLSEINGTNSASIDLKKQLWQALQRLFLQ